MGKGLPLGCSSAVTPKGWKLLSPSMHSFTDIQLHAHNWGSFAFLLTKPKEFPLTWQSHNMLANFFIQNLYLNVYGQLTNPLLNALQNRGKMRWEVKATLHGEVLLCRWQRCHSAVETHKRAERSQHGWALSWALQNFGKIPNEWHLLQTWNLLLHIYPACKMSTEPTEINLRVFTERHVKFVHLKYFIKPFYRFFFFELWKLKKPEKTPLVF